jgi:hypothetical protein
MDRVFRILGRIGADRRGYAGRKSDGGPQEIAAGKIILKLHWI